MSKITHYEKLLIPPRQLPELTLILGYGYNRCWPEADWQV